MTYFQYNNNKIIIINITFNVESQNEIIKQNF